MSNLFDIQKLPGEMLQDVAAREKALRKKKGFSQEELARKALVSLGSLRRFEQTGRISFESLVAISFALGCENELEGLFAKPAYASIQEVIDDAKKAQHH